MGMINFDDYYSRAFHKYVCEGYSQDLSRDLAERDLKEYKATWSSYSKEIKKARKGYKGNEQPNFDPLDTFRDKAKDPALAKYAMEIKKLGLKTHRAIAIHYKMPYSVFSHLRYHCLEEIIAAWQRPRDKFGKLVFY